MSRKLLIRCSIDFITPGQRQLSLERSEESLVMLRENRSVKRAQLVRVSEQLVVLTPVRVAAGAEARWVANIYFFGSM
jgi:hypothetical protein